MLSLKLAFRNIISAGLRTWLNAIILSVAYVLIVWTQGFYTGMMNQILDAMIESEVGGGQFWHRNYDPYDPFSLENSHSSISDELQKSIERGEATPVLETTCALYPAGRIQSAVLKGIDPAQRILNFPSDKLNNKVPGEIIPAVIGNRMAMNAGLSEGDELTIRWRDANGTYDAADIRIVHIFSTVVNTIDAGKIWIPIHKLQQMMRAPNEATIVTVAKNLQTIPAGSPDWIFRDHQYLMKDIKDFAAQKQQRSIIAYIILIGMALLAIFDTQVLSIFRRKKEMGTLMALGMTRGAVIRLFTLEGSLNGLIALILGSIYGIPLLTYTAVEGMSMPGMSQQMFSIGAKLYPQYGIPMYIGTSFLLFLAVVVVSFLPTRKIAKLKPTDALRGKTV